MSLHTSVWPLLLGTGICLGLGIPFAKLAALQGTSMLLFACLPTAFAGLVLGVLGHVRHGVPHDHKALVRFGLVAGLLGHALPMSALYALTARAGAGFAALAFTLPAVFTLAITLSLRLERPTWQRICAVALGFSGAAVLVLGRGASLDGQLLDVLTLLAIPASIGAGNVYRSRRMPPGVSGEWLSAATLLSSAGLIALYAGLGPETFGSLGDGAVWLGAQTVALVVGYLLYFALQRRAEPVTFSFMGYVSMLTGVAAGTLVFGERLAWTTVPALVLILVALQLLSTGAARRAVTLPAQAAAPR